MKPPRTRGSPAQASRQTSRLQFHCGKPPPAAEPSTLAVSRDTTRPRGAESEFRRQIAVNLKPDADFDENRRGPKHRCLLWHQVGPNKRSKTKSRIVTQQ
jgi:hypothetical protein